MRTHTHTTTSTGIPCDVCGDVAMATTDEHRASRNVSPAPLTGGGREGEGGGARGPAAQSHVFATALTHVQ